jgi:hypothetical protein
LGLVVFLNKRYDNQVVFLMNQLSQRLFTIEREFPKAAALVEQAKNVKITPNDLKRLKDIQDRHGKNALSSFIWALISGGISIPSMGRALMIHNTEAVPLPVWAIPAFAVVMTYHGYRGWNFFRELWLTRQSGEVLKAATKRFELKA